MSATTIDSYMDSTFNSEQLVQVLKHGDVDVNHAKDLV